MKKLFTLAAILGLGLSTIGCDNAAKKKADAPKAAETPAAAPAAETK
jgi:hypothetical protein